MIIGFVRNRILAVPHSLRNLPVAGRAGVVLDRTLFGWELKFGREVVDGLSEVEARYLKVFADMGFTDVPVPDDPEYMAQMLPELESQFERSFRHVESRMAGLLNPADREMAIQMVWDNVRRRLLPDEEEIVPPAASPEADDEIDDEADGGAHIEPFGADGAG
ncbi:MAG: hypothetical protein QME96_02475 [Myxococcota bacterium]|nr:hypothetical protein [Myxococcota bacterium]